MQLPVRAQPIRSLHGLIDAAGGSADQRGCLCAQSISDFNEAFATAPHRKPDQSSTRSAAFAKMDDASASIRSLPTRMQRLRHFSRHHRTRLEDAKTKPAKLRQDETLHRRSRSHPREDQRARQRAPEGGALRLPIADAKKQAAEYVAALAERGKPKTRIVATMATISS